MAKAAISSRFSRVSTAPLGLFGEFSSIAFVFAVRAFFKSSTCRRKPSSILVATGTSTPFAIASTSA